MAAPSKTYPLTDAAALAAKVKAAGGPQLDPTQPAGCASAETALGKVTLGWTIANGSITISIMSKPWDLAQSVVWEHVDALF